MRIFYISLKIFWDYLLFDFELEGLLFIIWFSLIHISWWFLWSLWHLLFVFLCILNYFGDYKISYNNSFDFSIHNIMKYLLCY